MGRLVSDVYLATRFFPFFKDYGGEASFGEYARRFKSRGA